jgi:hypothetical protein
VLLLGLVGSGLVYAYQHSFYSKQVSTFNGIASDTPFLCGELVSSDVGDDTLDGETLLGRLVARIEAHPRKAPPEYGMLALITGEEVWAEAFRESILAEAEERRFTDPANSVKFIQYQAALRVYYLIQVRSVFPDLLSESEWSLVREWLRAVNRRSLTVEWVDWMYGLAFSKWPEGPYENQENGAGLLALLEVLGVDGLDSEGRELSSLNQDYLERNHRGWFQRFRNTDDAYMYQPKWINNAIFQALYWGENGEETSAVTRNRELSFEWLLLQALPDGSAMGNNHPFRPPLAMISYLGAQLLHDPRYLWLSARSLEAVEAEEQYLNAQPGILAPVERSGSAPTQGSCLLFGDSGLPNQLGPLAPDKVVFRSGWQPDSVYLLLNLRFTGWHRYKSTNSVVWVHQDGPLAVESFYDEPVSWLPVGRSQFRDKRIPRDNLNGLLISRTGASRVIHDLIGAGDSPWAQDPPHYARVERFETLGPLDMSRTTVDGWRGWDHSRTIYFVQSGLIVIVDTAKNEARRGHAAVSWHLVGDATWDEEGLWLRRETSEARLALSQAAWDTTEMTQVSHTGGTDSMPDWDMLYYSPEPGRLDLATAFLLGDWADASYESVVLRDEIQNEPIGQHVRITGPPGQIELLHNEAAAKIESGNLSTDGQSIIRFDLHEDESDVICYIGGRTIRIQPLAAPAGVTDMIGNPLIRGAAWDWEDETLFVFGHAEDSQCVRVIPF